MSAPRAASLTLHLRPAGAGHPTPDSWEVGLWQATLETHDPYGHMVTVVRRPGLVAALLGVLYDRTLDSVLDAYRADGDAFAAGLEGSFALVLLDLTAGRALALTDRVGTRTLYHLRDGETVWISTRPDLPAFTRRPLSLAGLASSLVNGGLPAGLTLYDGVRALEATDLHDVRPEGLRSAAYWTLPFDPAPPGRPDAAYADDLIELCRSAVARRLRACGERPYLSLSGGYDSRGLLALLHEQAVPGQLHTFAYSLPAVRRGSDAEVASRLAAQYGAAHDLLIAYRGDLGQAIGRNARDGLGAVPYCEEIDALHDLAQRQPTDFFTGEQVFELRPAPLRTTTEQLARVHVNEFRHLGWLAPHLPPGVYDALQDAWQPEYDAISAQSGRWEHGFHKELELLLHHHESCRLLRWRELFVAQHANVHVPYLDTQVVEFMGRLPLHLMAGKTILKLALHRLDPALFRVPLASVQGYEANWRAELLALDDAAWARLLGEPSRLDAVIGPETIRHLAAQLPVSGPNARARTVTALRRALGIWRRTPTGRRVFGHPPLKPKVPTLSATVLKLLTLRQVLGSDQP